ncbi:MAG: DUF1820 family protein [Spirochaetales bacterium]|nr:DUF1820 family protein [Spirochaetales bacterium]
MSLYRVHFKWKEREVQLSARSLDLTHPYFVSIKDLVFADKKKLIINPADDEIAKAFGGARHLMIPFQTVTLIEELDEKRDSVRVRRFTLVEGRPESAQAEPVEGGEDPAREDSAGQEPVGQEPVGEEPEDSRG